MRQFAQDGPRWQLNQLQRRVVEWLEWQFRGDPNEPNPEVPDLSTFWQRLGDLALWSAIALLVVLISWLVWQVLRPYWLTWRHQSRQRLQLDTSAETQTQSVQAWQQQARRYQRDGNYTQACLCLYLGMLQRLDDLGIAPHQPSRTDGEYQRALAGLAYATPYYTLLAMHQNLKFGNQPASAELVERCLQAYAQL